MNNDIETLFEAEKKMHNWLEKIFLTISIFAPFGIVFYVSENDISLKDIGYIIAFVWAIGLYRIERNERLINLLSWRVAEFNPSGLEKAYENHKHELKERETTKEFWEKEKEKEKQMKKEAKKDRKL